MTSRTGLALTIGFSLALGLLWTILGSGLLAASAESRTLSPTIDFDCDNQSEIPASECKALEAIHSALSFDQSSVTWSQPCQSTLVRCRSGHVTQLRFAGKELKGHLPPSIRDLTMLEEIDLSGNPELSGYDQIHSFANLTRLIVRDADVGNFPTLMTSNLALELINFSNSNVTGTLPTSLGDLGALKELILTGNRIEGDLPHSLVNLSNLTTLNLAANALTGPLPDGMGRLPSLQFLILSANQISGTIPGEVGSIASLTTLRLDRNQIEGEIPEELGGLANLSILDLSDNRITGSIPAALSNAAKLTSINLDGNNVSGTLPETFSGITGLRTFKVQGNRELVGPVPKSWESLTQLEIETGFPGTQLCYGGETGVSESWADAHIVSHQSLLECDGLAVSGFIHVPDGIELDNTQKLLMRPCIDEVAGENVSWPATSGNTFYAYHGFTGTITVRPSLKGFRFIPPARRVTVPAQNVNFSIFTEPTEDTIYFRAMGEGFRVCRAGSRLRQFCQLPFFEVLPGDDFIFGTGDRIALNENDGVVVEAECFEREDIEARIQLFWLLYGEQTSDSVDTMADLLAILVSNLCDEQLRGSAATEPGDAVAFRLAQGGITTQIGPLLASLTISMSGGSVHAGAGDFFQVVYDPILEMGKLWVYGGQVELRPVLPNFPPFHLEAGQYVAFTPDLVTGVVQYPLLFLPNLRR